MSARSSKWWWLQVYSLSVWSADERRAAGAFLLTWTLPAACLAIVACRAVSQVLHLSLVASVAVSTLFWLSIGFPGLRGVTSSIFPNVIAKGDDAAAIRMGGSANLPTNEFWIREFWWINTAVLGWSAAQARFRQRAFGIAFVIFLPSFLLGASLLIACGLSERLAAFIGFAVTTPTALYASRQIAKSHWPDLVRTADDDAVKQYEKSVPPRETDTHT